MTFDYSYYNIYFPIFVFTFFVLLGLFHSCYEAYHKDGMLWQINHNSDLFLQEKQLEYYFHEQLHELETDQWSVYIVRIKSFSYQFSLLIHHPQERATQQVLGLY